jgi:hypothetical protein
LVIFAGGLVVGMVGWASSYFLCCMTWANQGLVMNCRGSKCFTRQVYKLISYSVASENYEATFSTTKHMLQSELGFTPITSL